MTENNNEIYFLDDDKKKGFLKHYIEEKEEESTGMIDELEEVHYIKYPFDRYIIKVAVSSNNEFIGIKEVEINKDFRNYKQKRRSKLSPKIEDFYFEE